MYLAEPVENQNEHGEQQPEAGLLRMRWLQTRVTGTHFHQWPSDVEGLVLENGRTAPTRWGGHDEQFNFAGVDVS
jgi:hypothetical protein